MGKGTLSTNEGLVNAAEKKAQSGEGFGDDSYDMA